MGASIDILAVGGTTRRRFLVAADDVVEDEGGEEEAMPLLLTDDVRLTKRVRRPNGVVAVVVGVVVGNVVGVGVVGVGRAEKASTITTATTAATTAHRAIGKNRADGDLVIVVHLHADESMAIGVQLRTIISWSVLGTKMHPCGLH